MPTLKPAGLGWAGLGGLGWLRYLTVLVSALGRLGLEDHLIPDVQDEPEVHSAVLTPNQNQKP